MSTVLGMDAIAFWIIATAALVNATGAMLGCFLVLRKMSMLGDAISHAILPGLAIAFVVTQSRDPFPMLIGAIIAGVLTAALTHIIQRFTSVSEDAAMGVVFTSLFALGVIIITRVASQVDLDPGCVLYGILESAALDTVVVAGLEVPKITLNMAGAALAVTLFVIVFWKELKIVSFDSGLATTLGINAQIVHYLLMAMVAIFTVAAFEAVGSILVVAALVVPAATAYLLTDRLHWMVVLSVAIGVISAVMARFSAAWYQTSVAGMASVCLGLLFVIAVIFAPRYGMLSKRIGQAELTLRVLREDILAMLYRWQEMRGQEPMPKSEVYKLLSGGLLGRFASRQLRMIGMIGQSVEGGVAGFTLQPEGRLTAQRLVRGHRLWETYLAKNFALPEAGLHNPADRMEHFLSEEMLEEVARTVETKTDPQGRPIP